jgi:hypothetical protein
MVDAVSLLRCSCKEKKRYDLQTSASKLSVSTVLPTQSERFGVLTTHWGRREAHPYQSPADLFGRAGPYSCARVIDAASPSHRVAASVLPPPAQSRTLL